ncbi:hypothetical protein AVEN_31816-1 [Araneus ventricosus]|uniref:Uncharacterized protein n=2 Tax=Araneus ventricosus TaxID=182803 RepID=A0A4Y2WVZ0_ARAVE|nr:hypothetical protein AVEN_31816-1 [Araneus ventricosus]
MEFSGDERHGHKLSYPSCRSIRGQLQKSYHDNSDTEVEAGPRRLYVQGRVGHEGASQKNDNDTIETVGQTVLLQIVRDQTTSLDDGMSLTTTTKSDLDFLGLTTSTDTYLQFLSSTLFGPPTTTTTTTSVLASIPSSIGMSTTSMLGRRDLSAPHSLSSYLRPSSYLLDSQGSEGPKLPSYIMSLKQQLRDELRSVTEQR